MNGKTVLVTNATTGAGLAATKALAAAGYKVITADFERLPLGLRSRYSCANHVLSGANQLDFERGLLELVDRVRPDVFLPLGTLSVFIASKNRERMGAVTAFNVPSLDAFMAAYNKAVCMADCRQLGIPCPTLYSQDQAFDMLDRDGDVVLVVKPDCDLGASTGVRYVRDREQLSSAVRECTKLSCGALIQEYIPGGVEAMKTAILLFSRERRLIAAFTTRKVRQWPEIGGLTAASRSTADEHLVRQVLPFFEKWRWCGAAEVELKFDSRNGQDKVIEINPRFPAYLRFPLECGLDFAAIAAALALDDEVPCVALPSYATGARYLNPGLLLRTVLSNLRSCRLASPDFREGLREMIGAVPVILRLLGDPLPLVGRALAGPKLRRASHLRL